MLDRLTLDQLRILVAVVETGSFSAASRRLGRVQSAISQSVQTLESTLGLTLFDRATKIPRPTPAAAALVEDARRLIAGAETLRARAQSIAADVEPELTLAVDMMFPNALLMTALAMLSGEFPWLPVALFTEGLGGAEQRLRDGAARLAIYSLAATRTTDLEAEMLTTIEAVPVVAASHPLAALEGPLDQAALEPETQLVLTDRSPLTQGLRGSIISRRLWRFADLNTRLDYLLAGFGWCNMPLHLVAAHIAAGRLKRLRLKAYDTIAFPFHIVHERGRAPGRAGRWLIAELRRRLAEA